MDKEKIVCLLFFPDSQPSWLSMKSCCYFSVPGDVLVRTSMTALSVSISNSMFFRRYTPCLYAIWPTNVRLNVCYTRIITSFTLLINDSMHGSFGNVPKTFVCFRLASPFHTWWIINGLFMSAVPCWALFFVYPRESFLIFYDLELVKIFSSQVARKISRNKMENFHHRMFHIILEWGDSSRHVKLGAFPQKWGSWILKVELFITCESFVLPQKRAPYANLVSMAWYEQGTQGYIPGCET